MAQPPRPEHEERQPELDREHHGRAEGVDARRQVVRVVAQPVRQRLRPVVVLEGRQVPPCRVMARELDGPRQEHQPEEQPAQEEARDGRGWTLPPPERSHAPRRIDHPQETRLEQEHIPLEVEERVADADERQVDRPEQECDYSWRHPQHQEHRERQARAAGRVQRPVARVQPEERRKLAPIARPDDLARTPEVLRDRRDAAAPEESAELAPERHEGDRVHQAQQRQEHAAREPPGRWRDVASDGPGQDPRGERAMAGDDAVDALGRVVPAGDVFVRPEQPALVRRECERAEHGLRAPEDAALSVEEMNPAAEVLGGHLRMLVGGFLIGSQLDAIAGLAAPAEHPAPAEAAVTIVDEARMLHRPHRPRTLS